MDNYIVYGLGISGLSTVKFLAQKFPNNSIIGTDDNPQAISHDKIHEITNKFSNVSFKSPELVSYNQNSKIIFSPGIPLYYPKKHKILEICKNTQAQLMCDLELFYLLNKTNNHFIGITGTNGKSTTTALIGFVLKEMNINCEIAGNIGIPCFELTQNQNYCYVFEISSYQLDLVKNLKFDVANLTNITPDHLDRHGNMANYCNAKKKIFANQTHDDYAIINIDNPQSKIIFDQLAESSNNSPKLFAISTKIIPNNGFAIINNQLIVNINNVNIALPFSSQYLFGEHNFQNIAFAFASIYCYLLKINYFKDNYLEVSKKIVDSIKLFKGLKHRLQIVKKIANICFINDSKATNAESSEHALKAFDNIFWILGGKPKDGGIKSLKPYFSKIIKAYLIGEASDEFAEFLEQNQVNYEKCFDLKTAFSKSLNDAKNYSLNQNNILLSPACASFDQWKNFEERGEYFCNLVNNIN
jgi:UDP-N-acetylmuramoylalanine--D-glutamate ligase